ncbi:MAG TPA: hypothetical protein VE287_08070, partial [Actinopolymorphaceae bacterium]|nr:hypothetical protein [Actinopolymorphaceae bacterium]
LLSQLDLAEVDATLVASAAALIRAHDLRGYDAVHCAAADALKTEDMAVAAGDQALLRTCQALRLAVVDTSG